MSYRAAPASARPLLPCSLPPWLLLLGPLALAAAWVALVLGTATWAEARGLDALFPYYDWHLRDFSAAGWQQAQRAAAGLALALVGAWGGLALGRPAGRRELVATGTELRGLAGQLRGQWRALSQRRRRFLLANLLLLTAARLYLSLTLHWADDAVSYEFFVRQRLLAVAAYYPLPNNHVLSNVLAWAFYQVHPGFWWSMRLPVLLTATAGTALLFAGLWRRLGYWPALLAAGAMSWVQLSLFHAAAGRGYWLVVLLTAVVFCSVLGLLDAVPARPRLAWLGLVAGGTLGLYAVPTFAYGLAAVLSWLGLVAAWRRQWRLLAGAGLAGLAVAAGAVLLYAPVLYVSGADALVHNPYVRPLPAGAFWRQLPAHAWFTEGYLLGQRHVGALGTALGLGLFGRLWRRERAGRLAPALGRAVRQVGLPALWCVLLPYLLLPLQRVLPPERTWLYKSWFFFVLLALGLAGWGSWQRPARRWLAGVGAGLFVAYQLAGQLYQDYQARRQVASQRAVYQWLARHPQARPVLVPDLMLWAWLRFEAHITAPGQPWLVEQVARPGVPYAYAVVRRGQPAPAGRAGVVLETRDVLVYRLYRPQSPGWPLPPRRPGGRLFWEKKPS